MAVATKRQTTGEWFQRASDRGKNFVVRVKRLNGKVGENARQGDVYFTMVQSIPKEAFEVYLTADYAEAKRKLAPGTTRGSRHELDSTEGVQVFHLPNPATHQGPFLKLATERTATHPDHGHVILEPGCYEITYQVEWLDEVRRVQD